MAATREVRHVNPTRPYESDRCRWGGDALPGWGPDGEPAGVWRHLQENLAASALGLADDEFQLLGSM